MYDTWSRERREDFSGWEKLRRLSGGYTAAFRADEWVAEDRRTTQWVIQVEVYRKRKHRNVESCQLTGPGGLEAPGFFLEALSEFEDLAHVGDRIQVIGADGLRFRLYCKILEKRGYQQTRFEGYPVLVKIKEEQK